MKRTGIAAIAFAVFVIAPDLGAAPTTFRNAGLKNETVVVLDVTGQTASGTFSAHSYGEEGPAIPFTGKIIATPKGKTGVYLEVKFTGPVPYDAPAKDAPLIWRLKIVKHRAHLFVPMQQRSYEGETPKWIVSDVELEPVTDG